MKACTYVRHGHFALCDKPVPVLLDPRDALVRVTLGSICTSDLHIKHGSVPRAVEGITVGHEMVGVVEQVGAEVATLRPGDRVAVNVETFCGECFFCQLLALALLLGLGQAEQARGYKRHTRRHKQHERTDHDEGNVARDHEGKRDARCSECTYIVGGAPHAGPEGGCMHARCQLCKGGGKERDKKARAQVKDDKA